MKARLAALIESNPRFFLLTRAFSGSSIVQAAGLALSMLLHVLLGRWLAPTGYGIFSLGISWLMITTALARFGFDISSMRYLSAYEGAEDWARYRGFLHYSRTFVLLTSLGALAIAYTCLYFADIRPDLRLPMLLVFPAVIPYAQCHLFQMELRAVGMPVVAILSDSLIRPMLLLATAGAIVLATGSIASHEALAANLAAVIATTLIAAGLARSRTPKAVSSASPIFERGAWAAHAFASTAGAHLQLVLNQADMVMLGFMRPSDEVGTYSAAARLAQMAAFFLAVSNVVAGPMISRLHSRNERAELQRTATFLCRMLLIVTLPIVMTLFFAGRWLLSWFGDDFATAHPALVLLTMGALVHSSYGPVGFFLSMTGHQNLAAILIGVSAGANIVLNALLIPRYGAEGAAMATATSSVLWCVLAAIGVRRRLGIRLGIFGDGRRPHRLASASLSPGLQDENAARAPEDRREDRP